MLLPEVWVLSSVSLEAISYKCRLLITVVDPLNRIYFQKLKISKKFYKLFLSKENFLNYFKNNLELKEKKISNHDYNNLKKTTLTWEVKKYFFNGKKLKNFYNFEKIRRDFSSMVSACLTCKR